MNEEEREYVLTENQDRLLSFAGWAKNLAWVALVIHIILAILVIPEDMIFQQRINSLNLNSSSLDYWDQMSLFPLHSLITIGTNILNNLLSGAIYYVVLKGISLGLYMLVETDINYREKESAEENHE
ncbi:MAG TPA: hypothetical protein DIW23_10750 [Anaerolineae bacterium]|nr:hypothetical protein [Anaerolineae bacterium]